MASLIESVQNLLLNFGPFFLLLGLLIFVHELGHFLVAKYYGVRVETFSLGFGKKILSYKRGDTTYCLSLIPLGGYVKMFGDDPTGAVEESEKRYAFLHKPLRHRTAIVLAGPLMNLAFAFVLFVMIAGIGEEVVGPQVGDVTESSKAYAQGFRSGDHVVSFDRTTTQSWSDVKEALEAAGGRAVPVVVRRDGEPQPLSFDVSVSMGPNENIFSASSQVGMIPRDPRRLRE
jgi:regulator of sigma E protease